MTKTKPSVGLICAFAAIVAVACSKPEVVSTPLAARTLRPIGPILALRMTPYRATELRGQGTKARRVPESHVQWRVDSVVYEVLDDDAEQVSVRIDGQTATLTGAVPTGWQAADIESGLSQIDVLRGATIEWRVLEPNAERPVDPAESEDAGTTPPTP